MKPRFDFTKKFDRDNVKTYRFEFYGDWECTMSGFNEEDAKQVVESIYTDKIKRISLLGNSWELQCQRARELDAARYEN